jgi:hypothetical protein
MAKELKDERVLILLTPALREQVNERAKTDEVSVSEPSAATQEYPDHGPVLRARQGSGHDAGTRGVGSAVRAEADAGRVAPHAVQRTGPRGNSGPFSFVPEPYN